MKKANKIWTAYIAGSEFPGLSTEELIKVIKSRKFDIEEFLVKTQGMKEPVSPISIKFSHQGRDHNLWDFALDQWVTLG